MQQATRHREDSHADSYTTRRDVTPDYRGKKPNAELTRGQAFVAELQYRHQP